MRGLALGGVLATSARTSPSTSQHTGKRETAGLAKTAEQPWVKSDTGGLVVAG